MHSTSTLTFLFLYTWECRYTTYNQSSNAYLSRQKQMSPGKGWHISSLGTKHQISEMVTNEPIHFPQQTLIRT